MQDTMAPSAEPWEGSFTWKIEGFSKLSAERKFSESFEIGGYQWRLAVHPKGHERAGGNDLCLSLLVADEEVLPEGWAVRASFDLIVHHKSDPEKSVRSEEPEYEVFNEEENDSSDLWFMKLDRLHDAENGFLVDDALTVGVQVRVKPDIRQLFTKDDGVCSLCLQFDGIPVEPSMQKERPVPNQKKRVKLNKATKQSPACLYLDAGFMSSHSKWIKGKIENMNLSAGSEEDKRSLTTIPVPKEFCPGLCSFENVQLALALLYFPREFPLGDYGRGNDTTAELLQVADYFQIRQLTSDLEDFVLFLIQEELDAGEWGIMKFLIEYMLWSERYGLKRCWSALKKGVLRKKWRLKLILKHEDFNKLSHSYQVELIKKR